MKDKFLSLYIGTRIGIRRLKDEKIIPFIKDEKGDIVQTAIIIGILGILAFLALRIVREPIMSMFNRIGDQLEDVGDFD